MTFISMNRLAKYPGSTFLMALDASHAPTVPKKQPADILGRLYENESMPLFIGYRGVPRYALVTQDGVCSESATP